MRGQGQPRLLFSYLAFLTVKAKLPAIAVHPILPTEWPRSRQSRQWFALQHFKNTVGRDHLYQLHSRAVTGVSPDSALSAASAQPTVWCSKSPAQSRDVSPRLACICSVFYARSLIQASETVAMGQVHGRGREEELCGWAAELLQPGSVVWWLVWRLQETKQVSLDTQNTFFKANQC